MLKLTDVDVIKVGSNWQVSGNIQQGNPVYELAVPLVLQTKQRQYSQVVGLYQETDCFVFTVADRPVSLSLDPENNLFRKLYPEEVPATVNSLRASSSQLVVIADGADDLYEASRDLLLGLQWRGVDVISETDYQKNMPADKDMLVIGQPKSKELQLFLAQASDKAKRQSGISVKINNESLGNAFFFVDKKSKGETVTAFFLPETPDIARDVARRIPHYGRYSYLAFKDGQNLTKRTWSPQESPLKVLIDKDL